jgi:DNA (cytosine-5)-methyltransferase 1
MKALDLFCGAGGAAMGLHRAGFEVHGVDLAPQPHYPFTFHRGDAMEWLLDGYDFIWASPPCQAYSASTLALRRAGKEYVDLLAPVRTRLRACGTPYVIENVVGAPMRGHTVLCGTMFGLRLLRHRLFETSFPICSLLPPCQHKGDEIPVYGHGTPSWHRGRYDRNYSVGEKCVAMGGSIG